jgi:hypothetical protein
VRTSPHKPGADPKVKYILHDYNRNDAQQKKMQKGDTTGNTDEEQVKLQQAGERNE